VRHFPGTGSHVRHAPETKLLHVVEIAKRQHFPYITTPITQDIVSTDYFVFDDVSMMLIIIVFCITCFAVKRNESGIAHVRISLKAANVV
jgi:hypothetical protein